MFISYSSNQTNKNNNVSQTSPNLCRCPRGPRISEHPYTVYIYIFYSISVRALAPENLLFGYFWKISAAEFSTKSLSCKAISPTRPVLGSQRKRTRSLLYNYAVLHQRFIKIVLSLLQILVGKSFLILVQASSSDSIVKLISFFLNLPY